MFRIQQYRPDFFSDFETHIAEFKTIEEFLDIDFVKNFTAIKEYPGYTSEGFFVQGDIGYIFHMNYNPESKRMERWGVAKVLEGDIRQLKEMFFNKWGLNH